MGAQAICWLEQSQGDTIVLLGECQTRPCLLLKTLNIAGKLELMDIADMVNKDSEMFCLKPVEKKL